MKQPMGDFFARHEGGMAAKDFRCPNCGSENLYVTNGIAFCEFVRSGSGQSACLKMECGDCVYVFGMSAAGRLAWHAGRDMFEEE